MGEELKGRTVECGSCEKRFQVTDAVLAPERQRVFPDELKKNQDLSRFGRAPLNEGVANTSGKEMRYEAPDKSLFVGPPPLIRTLFAVVGSLLLLGGLALFFFGAQNYGGVLQDVEVTNRLILGGFMGLLGCSMLIWGRMRGRALASMFGLLGLGGILALAWFMPVHRTISGEIRSVAAADDVDDEKEVARSRPPSAFLVKEPLTEEEVIKKTRWFATVQPTLVSGEEANIAAVWVQGMESYQRLQLQNYLEEVLQLRALPSFRELLSGGGLFLIERRSLLDLDELEGVVGRFGEVEQTFPDLRLIQMTLEPSVLSEVSDEQNIKLVDSTQGAFYSLNFQELRALQKARVKAAINRLAAAEPVRMRKDITSRLASLLTVPQDAETYGELAAALEVWSEPGDGADDVISKIALNMRERGQTIPEGILKFLISRKTPSAAVLLVELWQENPSTRRASIENYGSTAAPLIASFLRSSDASVARNAAVLLGKIGTKAELPQMQEALTGASNDSFKAVLQESIEQVARR